jgi:hypothetical protein
MTVDAETVRKTTIAGVWRLESRRDVDASGRVHIDPVLGPDPLGMLCFSSGHFAAQFMKRDRIEAIDQPLFVPGSNNSCAVNGYDAYFGRYTLDETAGTLQVHLDASIVPSNIGRTFTREVSVQGNTLTIALATTTTDGTPVTRTLTFTRLG